MTADSPTDDLNADTLKELTDLVVKDLGQMDEWWRRQSTWYTMRHDGLKRRNGPWPNCADQHYPLADSIIEKLKPFYYNQLFGTDTICSMISSRSELNGLCTEMGAWFDYKVKQHSNAETSILVAIDRFLMAGICTAKCGWDGKKKQLRFDALDPSKVIVPNWTEDLQDADRITLVHVTSVQEFKRTPSWRDQDGKEWGDEFVKSICGKGNAVDGTNPSLELNKITREGFTFSNSDQEIVYWEIWEQRAEGWCVHWVSPMKLDCPLRPSQKNPLLHGKAPLVRFQQEVKDTDHYSSRGIPEKIAAFETGASKSWNERLDYMTLCNRPLFTSAQPIPNPGNIRMTPGQFLPPGTTAVQMPPPPMSFEEEIQANQQVAQELIMLPNFGVGDDNNREKNPTATEVNRVAQLTNISVDLRARTFRKSVAELLQMALVTLAQFDDEFKYVTDGAFQELSQDAIAAIKEDPQCVQIQLNGSADSWNRQVQYQKAVVRKQLFGQSAWINQPELDKSIIELDDPHLIKRLFIDPNMKQQSDYELEATRIPAMLEGMPFAVLPDTNFQASIKCLLDFMHSRVLLHEPPNPMGQKMIEMRLNGLMQALQQKDPKALAQVKQYQAQLLQHGAQNGSAPPMNGAQPQLGAGMNGSAPAGPQGAPVKESVSINYKDAPEDIKRQMEASAGFRPSTLPQVLPPAPAPAAKSASKKPKMTSRPTA